MRFPSALKPAQFVRRENRFAATVRIGGQSVYVHVPNSGRMHELLTEGAPVLLTRAPGEDRATQNDLTLVRYRGRWVGVDSRMPPRLLAEAVSNGGIGTLAGWRVHRSEPAFGSGRLDLLLGREGDLLMVETKSVNYVEDGVARFPDAPSLRGARHLMEMAEASRAGGAFEVWFVVQRSDARVVRPFTERDPEFAAALADAWAAGVGVRACRCRVGATRIEIMDEVPVEVGGKSPPASL